MPFPCLPCTGEYLVDGYVRGGCPVCLADGCAGLRESCGHPIAAGDLIDPHSTMYPDEPVELRDARVLVLPVTEYQDRLRGYFAGAGAAMRPHMAQAIAEILSRPVPDFPITFPTSWGIPAPFPDAAGQVINPFAETMAWSIHCTALAAERRGAVLATEDELWFPEAGSRVVYFLGFDKPTRPRLPGPRCCWPAAAGTRCRPSSSPTSSTSWTTTSCPPAAGTWCGGATWSPRCRATWSGSIWP